MGALGLLPRSSSYNYISSSNCSNGAWQHLNSSAGSKKQHLKSPNTAESSVWSRLCRTLKTRRVGMLSAVLVSFLSFLTLINLGSHLSVHYTPTSGLEEINTVQIESSEEKIPEARREREGSLDATEILNFTDQSKSDSRTFGPLEKEGGRVLVTNTGNITSLNAEVQSTEATISGTESLSEGAKAKVLVTPQKTNLSGTKNRSNRPRTPQSSDQPLLPGHPCHGFTLPPPPADKKRTGPRPCPVCYLPVKKAILKMPAASFPGPSVLKTVSYKVEPPDSLSQEGLQGSGFGGHPSLAERKSSFLLQKHMNVHCGFARGMKPGVATGFDIDAKDLSDMDNCTDVVVASAIFGNYDLLQQPRNISPYSRQSVCFFMFVDEETHLALNEMDVNKNGIWRIVVVRNMPYTDDRRNGKIPKLLLHRLFPNARFSIWIDGKLQLVVDPYQVLERFLWRQNKTFAISQHYKRLDVFEEAEANKAAGKYDNSSIDAQINFYRAEGIQHFDMLNSPYRSDVPEGCVIIREHTSMSNLFTCLWFNEVDRFTSRDQLSFAIVRNKLMEKVSWEINMFLDCERRNFVLQGYHKEILEQKDLVLHTSSGQKILPNDTSFALTASVKAGNMALSHGRRVPSPRRSRRRRRSITS